MCLYVQMKRNLKEYISKFRKEKSRQSKALFLYEISITKYQQDG